MFNVGQGVKKKQGKENEEEGEEEEEEEEEVKANLAKWCQVRARIGQSLFRIP